MPSLLSATPATYLKSLEGDSRATLETLHRAIRKAAPKLKAELMPGIGATPIIGYGKFHYRYASGREGDWFLVGLCARKNYFCLYICAADQGRYLAEQAAATLGKVKVGRSCITFKRLEDLKLDAAMALVKRAGQLGGAGQVAG
jgi:hypothetical protein